MTVLRLFRSGPRSPEPDADLLAKFAGARDEAAFAELLNRHGPLVYRVCRRLLDASRADDAFQATFLVLATRADRVRKAASVGSWLIGVAGRVARQVRRKVLVAAAPAPLDNLAGSEASAIRSIETADLGRVLDEELTRLPDNLRAVVVACLVEERTQAEAAEALGESERTVRRRVSEARQLLRERLERRGVVPAVVVGLLASIGTATAVPPVLVAATKAVVFDFLAGGAAVASVPAVLANGVAMTGFRKTLAASLAAVALGLSALGVGLADDKPKPSTKAEQTIPPQNVPLNDKDPVPPPRPVVLEPPLFVVTGADELANRVVQREAEFIARKVAERWGVQPLPQLKEKWRIVLKIEPTRTGGASTFTFEQEPKRGVQSMEMQLFGSLEQILRTQLPHEITHCVLAAHFGRPVPRWVDEGIAVLSESGKEQVDHDRRVRELVNAGRCLALRHLLPMKEYPRDLIVLYAQGHSVARFLHERDAKKLLPLVEASFADGWDKALKATYGFKDADALEEAWLAWLKKPTSVLKAEAKTAQANETKGVVPFNAPAPFRPVLDLPKELTDPLAGPYTVAAPDILIINGKRLIPLEPHKIEPLDALYLNVAVTPEKAPINGIYPVDDAGKIDLGKDYGGLVKVSELTAQQVEQKLKTHLRRFLKEPTVSVSPAQSKSVQQIKGEHLIRPDGTVGLGTYGSVYVAGMTLPQAKAAIEKHLSKMLLRPEVTVDVGAVNSKFYYVITDFPGNGEQVQRLPATGNETVLDAIAAVGGLSKETKKKVWIARPASPGSSEDQTLPVDWKGISTRGHTRTNYQILPGDRLFILSEK